MPHEKFVAVESEVYAKLFSLVHSKTIRADERLAGVAALDALLSVPSFDEEKKAIRFGNNLSHGLKAAYADYEFLHAVARALGRMAMGAANVDRVEFEIGRSLEWLRSDRSDRRLAAVLVLGELARCAPTAFYSKTHNFLDHIFPVLRDPQPIVRVCAADALSECLQILMERQHRNMTASLLEVGDKDSVAYANTTAVHSHGSLLVVSSIVNHSRNFILPRFDEVCTAVLSFMDHPMILIRLEVVRLIPKLAQRCPGVYGRRYLEESLDFLISCAATSPPPKGVDMRPTAFSAIGQLAMAMSDEELGGGDISIPTVRIAQMIATSSQCDVLGCFSNMVEALGQQSAAYVPELVEDLFEAGLSEDLIKCLHSIAASLPSEQSTIERRLFEEISSCLAGTKTLDVISNLYSTQRNVRPSLTSFGSASMLVDSSPLETSRPALEKSFMSSMSLSSMNPKNGNMLLPFLQSVISMYLVHPSNDVRREAAIACCMLLLPFDSRNAEKQAEKGDTLLDYNLGNVSGSLMEEVLQKLLRMAVSDLSPIVRLCVVRGLDERYDSYLCQLNLLPPLFLMLEDEALAVRACALQLLGRLSRLNPAPILPGLRRVLVELIIELRCGGDNSGGREAATRLIVVFLREEALRRLVRPFISSIIDALPLSNVAPRLVSTSLEALGELATVGNSSISMLRQLIPHILKNMQDQNSSKQRVSLWTMGKIAYGTSYVVVPYLEYPQLLSQASDVLPTTKRAPWYLRREVFRMFGILGALDPDRFLPYKIRKGGGVGGGYFVELEDDDTGIPLSNLPPARRLLPSDDDFYPTVAVQALMRILKNPSLSNLHGMVMKAVMFIFNALGLRSVPFLKQIVPHILSTIKSCGQPGLREALLQQISSLSAIVREHLRPYLPAIFDVVEEFWFTRHLSALCSLVERVATAVPDDFRIYVPLLVRLVLASVEAIDVTEWSNSSASIEIERLDLILKFTQGIKGVLGEYIHLVVPALVNLTDTVETLSILLQTVEITSNACVESMVKSNSALPARVVQPFLRMLGGEVSPNKAVGNALVESICICVRQLGAGRWMSFYHVSCYEIIGNWQRKLGIELPAVAGAEKGARSGASDVSLTGIGDSLKPPTRNAPSIQPIVHQTTAHRVNLSNLQKSWDVSQKSSREDWDEWMRRFSIQLLREAPSPALRACAELAQAYSPLARELFSAAFVCCWTELNEQYRSNLVFSLETVYSADASLEILQLLLNLAEFMEHDVDLGGTNSGLPINISVLADLALKCRAYSKALHYKEREYINGRSGSCVEQLIDINKKLDLPEAALGVLKAAKIEIERQGGQTLTPSHNHVVYESWLAKLGSWAEALSMYEQKLSENPYDVNSILGCMQCYDARGEWQRALELAERSWGAISGESKKRTSSHNHRKALKFCAQAAWRLGKWDELETGSKASDPKLGFDGAFYRAVLHIHRAEWDEANSAIDAARKAMDSRFTALLAESYKRAYPSMVAAQTLSELEEIISYRQFEIRTFNGAHLHAANRPDATVAKNHLLDVWRRRLDGCRVDAEVHSSILAVRSLVLGPTDDVDATITLAALSRQAEAFRLAERTLLDPLAQMEIVLTTTDRLFRLFIQHKLYFAYVKNLWATDRRDDALARLGLLCNVVDTPQSEALRVSCWLRYGDWKVALNPLGENLPDSLAEDVLVSYKRATDAGSKNYRAWHSWALINFRLAEQIHGMEKEQGGGMSGTTSSILLQSHVIAAVKGFVLAISMGTKRWSASVQQDMLNLLSCLFKYGELRDVSKTINEGLVSIKIEAWLGVLPQLLARIHIKAPSVRSVLHPLLVRLGAKHPQALMYPLSVLLKSPVLDRKLAAESLMNSLKAHSNALVEEARMVSTELIRVAILWLELWHEGLEDASRLYYGEGNVSAMLDVLIPLHQQLEKGASTRREQDFLKSFGRDLLDAHKHIKDYAEAALNQAWDLYYTVFRRINKQLPGMTTLELNQCSPALYNARNLELGVPGSYRVDGSYVKIERFITSVQVITSKQRPRKIIIRGNDGKDYVFLLKGHEDLRQDERVMQLFGLVNALLARDRRTNKHDLNIQRYAIAPLSHNAGVVGWVPHCDTLHCLIRDYRESLKVPLNAENREMMALAPNYDSLTAMQKVEIFTEALDKTAGKGNDLYEVLWIKSTNSEEWLERRTNFTRSLAVMSMVGYILGLGDRHPSNLMLDQVSGRVLHIDFGDCFEVAMHREKFPEKVPFRLTRMLTRAMEVSGIEGSYRSTCERTMAVLRDNKDSLVAMLEAFVYDPLISWRVRVLSSLKMYSEMRALAANLSTSSRIQSITGGTDPTVERGSTARSRIDKSMKQRELMSFLDGDEGDANEEALNEKALKVIRRVQDKLAGTDFHGPDEVGEPLDVPEQVQRLIVQATSSENLCQLFIGWCAFW
ncbi:phosphatidylinositol 3-kinase (PI3K)-like protein [Thalassiosira pseudonana CCMP1335]|uniref:Serine/threonine-protein kinase TOR n=1 Tax=Thalassiosira pseudonana TaxID=35128 RepID=B8CAU9_THAPS|nr:phosphatidylinositol 3-kinase (PI3K)-like protein [Thalassiosira pseudonana CCMP1335]EED89568.1 phosphatidylinositol 3-kinase (PI3K)-like protein [Thalassiosira pseudonana CCMP1335]